jgi:hypothetical protein
MRVPLYPLLAVLAIPLIGTALFLLYDRAVETKVVTAPDAAPSAPRIRPEVKLSPQSAYSQSTAVTGREQSLAAVNSVSVRPVTGGALIVRAGGIAASSGWSKPALVPFEDAAASKTVQSYKFVALPPETPDKSSAKAVYVQLRIDNPPAGVQTIRIVTASNALSATLQRPMQAKSASDIVSSPPRP